MLNGRFVRTITLCYVLFSIGYRLFPVGLHYYVIWEAVGEGLEVGARAADASGPSLTEKIEQAVSKRVLFRAEEVGLPLEQDSINVSLTGTQLTVKVIWTEAVNFWSYSWTPRLQVIREAAIL